MITYLLIGDEYCVECQEIRDHELNAVACEIQCQTCNTVTPVSEHYVNLKLGTED